MKTVFKPLVNNLQTIVKRTYFTGAIELRREVLQNLSKDDKNVKKFFDYYNSSVIKDHQFKNNQDIISINTTLENAIEDDKKLIEQLPLLAHRPYLFGDVFTRIESGSIPINDKIKQMKNSNPDLYKEYITSYNIWTKKTQAKDILEQLGTNGFKEYKLVLASTEVLFNGVDKAITEYSDIIPRGSKSYYSLPTDIFTTDDTITNTPLTALSYFIPNKTQVDIQTLSPNGTINAIPIYEYQLMGIEIMYTNTLITDTTYNTLHKFICDMRESIVSNI